MKIELTFLGTGSAFSKTHGNNSAVLSITNGETTKNLLLDCGRTTPDDLHRSKFSWQDIDAIFITHLHGDHVYGLEEAGFFGRYVLKRKPHLILPHQQVKDDLWEKVLRGTMEQGDLPEPMTFEDYFTSEVVDERDEHFFFNDCMISVYSTEHVEGKLSYGLIISEYDYILYTSDSLFNEELVKMAVKDGAQAIFHDCQMTGYPGQVHASLDELEKLPNKYKRKITLMHYGDDLAEHFTRVRGNHFGIATRGTSYTFEVK